MCNAEQHSDAPGYVLVHQDIVEDFLQECNNWIVWFYGADPRKSKSYGRIVDSTRMNNLVDVLEETIVYANAFRGEAEADMHVPEWELGNVRADWSSGHCKIIAGGTYDKKGLDDETNKNVETRYIAPTLLFVSRDVPIMEAERDATMSFGPILPIVAVKDTNDAIEEINGRPVPSSLYIFSDNRQTKNTIVSQTRSGGVTINGCLWHRTHVDLSSTNGANGGGSVNGASTSFERFSRLKPVMEKGKHSGLFDGWIFPPFENWKEKWSRFVLRCNHW